MAAVVSERGQGRRWAGVALGGAAGAALVGASSAGLVPLDPTEAWGFATGAACVWLAVRQNVWTFPLGLANNVFLGVLFFDRALYADAGLQVVYALLGLHGWWSWLRGGPLAGTLAVGRASWRSLAVLAVLAAAATAGLVPVLAAVQGRAPFWDALTTAASLAAQYLLNRKRLESWYLWIAVDLVYIPLYLVSGLPLTAALYGVFLLMCLAGWRAWRRTLTESERRGVAR